MFSPKQFNTINDTLKRKAPQSTKIICFLLLFSKKSRVCNDCMMAQSLTEEDKGESKKDVEGTENQEKAAETEEKREGNLSEEAAVLETDTGK